MSGLKYPKVRIVRARGVAGWSVYVCPSELVSWYVGTCGASEAVKVAFEVVRKQGGGGWLVEKEGLRVR